MKKNVMMRIAACLLVCVLASTCGISGTFAKYVTSTSSEDQARVAVWGINADTVEMDLFDDAYSTDVESNDGDNVIAPGTTKTSNFSILNTNATLAPEVKYEIAINLDDAEIADAIKNNPNIQWKLDDNAWGTWDQMIAAIKLLSGEADGSKVYNATEIATEFANGKTHTISWQWLFENDADSDGSFTDEDAYDTEMGNLAASGDIEVLLKITITATQVND